MAYLQDRAVNHLFLLTCAKHVWGVLAFNSNERRSHLRILLDQRCSCWRQRQEASHKLLPELPTRIAIGGSVVVACLLTACCTLFSGTRSEGSIVVDRTHSHYGNKHSQRHNQVALYPMKVQLCARVLCLCSAVNHLLPPSPRIKPASS